MKLGIIRNIDLPEPKPFLPDSYPVEVYEYSDSETVPEGQEELTLVELLAAKEEHAEQVAIDRAAHNAQEALEQAEAAELADLMDISFEDMPLKLPGLAWALIEAIGFTEEEKDIVILALGDFHKYLNAGYVVRGIQKLNESPTPEGVDSTKWATLLAQVNQIVGQ